MNHRRKRSIQKFLSACLCVALGVTLAIPGMPGNLGSAAAAGINENPAPSATESGNIYFVSNDGDDSNDGRSMDRAWATLDKVNGTKFEPGDRILFKAGDVWNGSLKLRGISGTKEAPVVFSSYDDIGKNGRPVINGNGTTTSERSAIVENYKGVVDKTMSATIDVVDGSYLEFSNFELTNYNPDVISQRAGINIRTSSSTVTEWEANPHMGIVIKNNYIHDVNGNPKGWKIGSGGILILGNISDVLVEGNTVKRVDIEGIRNAGLYKEGDISANFPRVLKNIIFNNNYVEEVQGDGFVMSNVGTNGRMEYNTVVKHSAKDVGNVNYAGLWVIGVKDMTMQFNEVYGGIYGYNDGQAFDVDMFCEGTLYQYNYSHSNRGGFMLFMDGSTNSVARYNVSVNDGDGRYLLHYLPTQERYAPVIHNNTFFTDSNVSTKIFNASGKYAKLYNNIFYSKADTPMGASSFSGGEIQNNIFYPGTGIKDTVFPGAALENNIFQSPRFARPGEEPKDIVHADSNFFDAEQLNGYKLLAGSPAINAGLDIRAKTPSVWGAADKDFFNNPLIDQKIDIGAHEYSNDEPGNQSPEVLPLSIKLSHDKLDLYAQQAGKTLAAAFEPRDAWFKGVKWSSRDTQVAAVNSSGFVMPLKPGEAIIRAESTVNPSVYAEAHVTVHETSPVASYRVASDHNELSEANPEIRLRIDGVTKDGLVMEHAPYTHVRYKADHDQVTIDPGTGMLKAVGNLTGTDEIEVSADVEEYKDLLYTQSFEAGWGDFMPETGAEIQTGAISDAVAYQGNKSALFVTGNGSNAIQKLFGSKQQGIVTMMMYDDGSTSAKTRVVAHVGNARSTLLAGMGLLYDGSSYGSLDYYSVRASNVSSAWEATPIKRSKGWHELKWDYTSGVDLKMYIDGQLVKTTTAIKDFDRIVLGFLWDAANGRTFAFDNIKYASTDEKVAKQAEKLILPVLHKIDKTVLEQTITVAQNVYDPAVEGNEPGQYPAGSKALLFGAIERAREVLGKETGSQAEVDAAVAALQEAVSLFQASVIVDPGAPVDKSKLNEAITAAKAVYAEAVEGTEPGQYPREAKLRLHAAIERAEAVLSSEDITQNDIHAAVLTLNAAVAEFKSSVNPDRTAPTWKQGKLKSDQASTSSIALTWSGEVTANQVKGYKIYRDGTEIATVTGAVYRYDVTGLYPDTWYTFKVEAGNEHGHWSSDGPSARVKTDAVTSGSDGSGGGSSNYVPAPSVPKTEDPEKTKPTKPAEVGGQAEAGQPKPTKPNAELTDVNGHWAEKAIREAVELGWVQGYKDGTFRPDAKISRAEFAVLLGRALKLERQENVNLKDFDRIPSWARPFISGAIEAGIMTGYSDRSFRPAQKVTRLEMAVMIARAMDLPLNSQAKVSFKDAEQIPDWARPYLAAAMEAKLIQGRSGGVFAPNDHATRAESISVIISMLSE